MAISSRMTAYGKLRMLPNMIFWLGAPLVLEARGLDATPIMIDRFKVVGDNETSNALGIIMSYNLHIYRLENAGSTMFVA